jgi:hypothetical protein
MVVGDIATLLFRLRGLLVFCLIDGHIAPVDMSTRFLLCSLARHGARSAPRIQGPLSFTLP